MAGSIRGKGPIADINVTPLVDVMMVLLILFLVVAQLDDSARPGALPIQLPRAATATREAPVAPLAVTVGADGKLYLRGKPASETQIQASVASALASDPDAEVAVAADRNAAHERFVHLLDLLRGQGVVRFAVQAEVAEVGRGG